MGPSVGWEQSKGVRHSSCSPGTPLLVEQIDMCVFKGQAEKAEGSCAFFLGDVACELGLEGKVEF